MTSEGLNILFVASEAAPFAKTGGLGDVAGSLPPALGRLGHHPSLILPLYANIDRRAHGIEPTGAGLRSAWGSETLQFNIWQGDLEGCPAYFLECDPLFGRPGLYGENGKDYADNLTRFGAFCRAVPDVCSKLGLQSQIIHAHDWQTGLLPAYLRAGLAQDTPLSQARCVFTIHNLAYQGLFPRKQFEATSLPPEFNTPRGLEYWGKISLLKSGLVYAHALTTVSPTYAREILTQDKGLGLDGVLRNRMADLHGILNGADYGRWSPENDPSLPARYSKDDLSGKEICQARLLEGFGLEPAGPQTAVLGLVSRLTGQKGIDLLLSAAPYLLMDDVRLCILGDGEPVLAQGLEKLARDHPGRVGVRLGFDEGMAHLLVAGSDIFLMPSRFEPCGLTQLYALRYGTAPVVHATGGLGDTVEAFDPLTGKGDGFLFEGESARGLLDAVREALWTRARPGLWQGLMRNAMARDFSWERSARAYADLYAQVLS